MEKQIRLAIADDHSILRNGLTELINSCSKSIKVCLQADNGRQLINKLQATTILPDVCIIDINMPVLNGYETLTVLQNKWPGIKVLAMSMYDHEYAIIDMMRRGACGFMSKSGELNELFTAIEWVYEHGFYHNELVDNYTKRMLHVPELKDKEIEFLHYCCSDMSYSEIAATMHVSKRTVEAYKEQLCKKLKLKSRPGLIAFAMQTGMFSKILRPS